MLRAVFLLAALVAAGPAVAATQCGKASYYSYTGHRTANGERFDGSGMTAAHKTLPFGTIVTVTDQRTKRSIRVRINDRGPYVKGRIIDLSKEAARRLGTYQAGVAPVCISY